MVKDLTTKFEYPIAGSIRIGEKTEKSIPKRLDYFTVHEDTHTTKEVVNQFNSIYKNPKELRIKFLSETPLEINYLRYGKSGLLCKGDGETASALVDKQWKECQCSRECTHRGNECKLTGRLHFIIKDMNIGGLWRFQTQSYTSIENIMATINFLKCMGVNLTEKEFRLSTEEKTALKDGKTVKYTAVNLKMIENNCKNSLITEEEKQENKPAEIISNNTIEEKKLKKAKKVEKEEIKPEIKVSEEPKDEVKITEVEKTEESEKVQDLDDFEKVLSLIEIKTEMVGDKEIKTASFCTMTNEVIDLLLHPEIVDQVSNYSPSSAILPIEIYEKNNKKILKKFKEIEVIKKAV